MTLHRIITGNIIFISLIIIELLSVFQANETTANLLPANEELVDDSSLNPVNMEAYEANGMNYWLYIPENSDTNMPLIVYLHGFSGKGDDPEILLHTEEVPEYLMEGTLRDIPAYILMPQLPDGLGDWRTYEEIVMNLISDIEDTYKINSENISLTGFSMGGSGVWSIAAAYPDKFRCIAPCSGALPVNSKTLSALEKMPVWTFIGTEDTVINPQFTINFMKYLSINNPNAVMTKLEGATHTDIPALVYLSEEINLFQWMINPETN
ncbi:MAG: alpha/beta hydrolase-fold protein [Bacillota bacterium]|nr:alpha/beta hydrolase-fold protein [Bacillota bacterium]